MIAIGSPLLFLALVAADPPKPVAEDGIPDYEAALNTRLSRNVTPDRNANVLIWKAIGPTPEGGKGMPAEYFRRLGVPEPPKDGDYFIGIFAYRRDRLQLDSDETTVLLDQQSRSTKRPWTAAEYPHLAAWLAANEKPLSVIIEATKRPEYYNPLVAPRTRKEGGSLIGVLLSGVQKCREVSVALTGRAMLRLSEGKADAAGQDLLACHRLGRLVARGSLIELLVGFAIGQTAMDAELAYLERADLTPAQLRARQAAIQELPPLPSVADAIDRVERYVFLDSLRLIRTFPTDAKGLIGESGREMTEDEKKAWAALDWEPAIRRGNDWYDRMAAALRLKTRAARLEVLDRIDREVEAFQEENRENSDAVDLLFGKDDPGKRVVKRISNTMIALLAPSIRRLQDSYDRAEQSQRNLRMALALAAYRRDEGRYPANLGELVPKYLTVVQDDLFTGKGLVYRKEGTGYLMYSVGLNGRDEGGRGTGDQPVGDDLRVRLPQLDPERAK